MAPGYGDSYLKPSREVGGDGFLNGTSLDKGPLGEEKGECGTT